MDEYISRKAAKEMFKCIALVGTDYIMQRLDDVPAADVVEVRHGEWVADVSKLTMTTKVQCSVCGYFEFKGPAWDESFGVHNFCPNCGAKMDGKGDDNGTSKT